MRILLLFALVFCCNQYTSAQAPDWQRIEKDLSFKNNLTKLHTTLESIKKQASENADYITFARAIYTQIRIADFKTEDSSYFKNSFVLDSILAAKKAPAMLLAVVHVLQAKRIAGFRQNLFGKRNKNLFWVNKDYADYRKLTLEELDSTIQWHLEEAKKESYLMSNTNLDEIIWLSSDAYAFLFKPNFTDIIFAEQIMYAGLQGGHKTITQKKWMQQSPDEFIQNDFRANGFEGLNLIIANLYKAWAAYHKNEKDKYYYIEAITRVRFFNTLPTLKQTDSLYENYLLKLTTSPYTTAKGFGVYQLYSYWYEQGKKYNNQGYINSSPYYYYRNLIFDSTYKNYFTKAVNLYDENKQVLDSFYFLKQRINILNQQLFSTQIKITSNANYIPGQAIDYHVEFKNADSVYFKIVKLNAGIVYNNNDSATLAQLRFSNAFKTSVSALPKDRDFQTHALELTSAPLPAGTYGVMYNDTATDAINSSANYFVITVSNIAAINSDERLFLLDRKTGAPLKDATALVYYAGYNKEIKIKKKKADEQGSVVVNEAQVMNVFVVNGTDTGKVNFNKSYDGDVNEDVFDKDEYDDIMEFYSENIEINIFTDRAIYRPGQTVFFKGIVMTKNAKTGERIVLTEKNIKLPFWKKLFDKKVKDITNEKIEFLVEDPFDKDVDTLYLSLNKFGSLAGSFKIPLDAPTGDWEIETNELYDLDNRNSGSFKVEEYKRPTFELSIEKPTNYLQLGDSFYVKVKVKSFTGSTLNNIEIEYEADASFRYTIYDSLLRADRNEYKNINLLDSTGYTNDEGEFFIKIFNDSLSNFNFSTDKEEEVRYYITATAIDASGESYKANKNFALSSRPVDMSFSIPKMQERNAIEPILIKTKNGFSGSINKSVEVNVFRKATKENISRNNFWRNTDYIHEDGNWVYRPLSLEIQSEEKEEKILLYHTTVQSNIEKVELPKNLMVTGDYEINAICKEEGKIIGEKKGTFSVFDVNQQQYPDTTGDFHFLKTKNLNRGDKIAWFFGTTEKTIHSIYQIKYYEKINARLAKKTIYNYKTDIQGIREWNFTVPKNAVEKIYISHAYILADEVFIKTDMVSINEKQLDLPEIIIEQYKKILAPGAKEAFVVSVKTKNKNIAAELMTTMYDASLDKIEEHRWNLPYYSNQHWLNQSWNEKINEKKENSTLNTWPLIEKTGKENSVLLWWLNPLSYNNNLVVYDRHSPGLEQTLSGRVSGLTVMSNELNDVVVTALGIQKKSENIGYATAYIRGTTSITNDNKVGLFILDGKVYEGDLSKIDANLITDVIILKGADAAALYGSQAANGVIIISTKGPIQLPKPEEPPVKIRKDFSETAFFFPQVHANKKGEYSINFTMPESVTKWNWKMLAHTTKAAFVYAERVINTQLPLMVQPNMPRFLYQGDRIFLQTRITNLDTTAVTGTATCTIEDAVTGEDITKRILVQQKNNFNVPKKSNSNTTFSLKVPDGFLHPLTIRLSARAGNFADGEEYTIPVLSKKILVAQNVLYNIVQAKDTVIQMSGLPADAVPYGVGMYITAKPQSAMVNALPTLAFYPFNCAEQTFNKMFAHTVAIDVIKKDSIAQQTIAQLKTTKITTTKPEALPEELSQATMPWLQLNTATQQHQQQLLKVFDTTAGQAMQKKHFDELVALQNGDGGITWFTGGESNPYISYYLMEGFGKLKNDKLEFISKADTARLRKFLTALVSYCDKEAFGNKLYSYEQLMYLNARSYWLTEYTLSASLKKSTDSLLILKWQNMPQSSLGAQAQMINISIRYAAVNDKFATQATAQLESIRQLAIMDEVSGIRWKDISNADDFNCTDEETIAQLATAFENTGSSKSVVDGIIHWLLKAKEQHNWQTTKATAAVIELLYKNQQTVTGKPINLTATLSDITLTVSDNLFNGQLFGFAAMKKFPNQIKLNKSTDAIASGGFNFYYFTSTPPANEQNNGVKISKILSRYNKASSLWEKVTDKTILHIGDKVQTTITIDASKELRYVYIDEKRAAALDPADGTSGYEYGNGFKYYFSVRDAGYQIFADRIPSGISSLSYETIVAKEGVFNNGTIALQCMYKPGIRAYASGVTITAEK